MGLNPSNKPATRHVNMRVHMLLQHVELSNVSTLLYPTKDMVADYMNKATPKPPTNVTVHLPWVIRISRLLCFLFNTSLNHFGSAVSWSGGDV